MHINDAINKIDLTISEEIDAIQMNVDNFKALEIIIDTYSSYLLKDALNGQTLKLPRTQQELQQRLDKAEKHIQSLLGEMGLNLQQRVKDSADQIAEQVEDTSATDHTREADPYNSWPINSSLDNG